MGILEESQRARGGGFNFRRSKKIIIIVVLLAVAGGAYAFWSGDELTGAETRSALKEWTVKRDDIVISVESTGQVVAEDGVELSFGLNDDNLEVKEVFVKEGDTVKKGDKIATVETDDLELSLTSAWNSYQSTLAYYNETMAGATDDEIADAKDRITTAEIGLEQARQSLDETRQNVEESIRSAEEVLETAEEDLNDNQNIESSEAVADAYEDLVSTIKSISITLEGILPDSDKIIGVDNKSINDDFEAYLGAKDISTYNEAGWSYELASEKKDAMDDLVAGLSKYSTRDRIDEAAEKTSEALASFEEHLLHMQNMLKASITSSDYSQTTLDSHKSTISSNRNTINTKITTLETDVDGVDEAKEGLDDYVEAYEDAQRVLEEARADGERDIYGAEAGVTSKEISLEQAKRDHDDLIAPLTEAELASARSKLTSASISLQKSQNSLDDATLMSPIEGQIVELNYKAGDIIVDNDEPVAVVLNSETLFVKVDVEEADVSKLRAGQRAVATFDALDELRLEGEVSFISLTSNTSNNGIVTYEVRVLINNPEENKIREGMTAYIDFISSGVSDVLVAPVSAVRNVEGKPSVLSAAGGWIPVTTGFTDGKYVEIINGLEAGDKILY